MNTVSNKEDVFSSFPRTGHLSARVAANAKAKTTDAVYPDYVVARPATDLEHELRFDYCHDLAQQLAAYCQEKSTENPSWSQLFSYERAAEVLRERTEGRIWYLCDVEVEWMLQVVRDELKTKGWGGLPA